MRAAAIVVAAFAAFGLVACGGGGGGTTSTAEAGPAPSETAKAAPGHGPSSPPAAGGGPSHGAPLTRASARRAERRAEAVQVARHRALAKKAGHAAPFLVPTGDNSIPTYGSEASSSQQGAATASLTVYLDARAGGDWSTACAEMAAQVQKQLALLAGGTGAENARGCAAAYAKLSSRVPAAERANPLTGGLAVLRVKGEKAFALFSGPHHQQYMMPMASEGGAWKVSQLDPIPWPIGAPAASP